MPSLPVANDVFGLVLMKCRHGEEAALHDLLIGIAHKSQCHSSCALLPEGAPATSSRPCLDVSIREIAYIFGPFDLLMVLQAPSPREIQQFVVNCLRSSGGKVLDTQTIIGTSLYRAKRSRAASPVLDKATPR